MTPKLIDNLTHEVSQLRAELDSTRRYLWLNHGCRAELLYGDDGEMQCNAAARHPGGRPLDFRRDDLISLIVAANKGAVEAARVYSLDETMRTLINRARAAAKRPSL